MPLPAPRPMRVQAPAGAGIGLRFHIRDRIAQPGWPADYWQRNLDDPIEWDTESMNRQPFTDREMRLPPPPPS